MHSFAFVLLAVQAVFVQHTYAQVFKTCGCGQNILSAPLVAPGCNSPAIFSSSPSVVSSLPAILNAAPAILSSSPAIYNPALGSSGSSPTFVNYAPAILNESPAGFNSGAYIQAPAIIQQNSVANNLADTLSLLTVSKLLSDSLPNYSNVLTVAPQVVSGCGCGYGSIYI